MNRPTRLLRAWQHTALRNDLVGFADELLHGFGQVMFQNSPLTGLLFMIGIFAGGVSFGLYALLGTAAGTLTARLFGVPDSAIKAGLYGYDGALAGIGLAAALPGDPLLPLYVFAAGSVSTIVAAAIGNVLATWQLPALTGPFVVTTALFALGIVSVNPLSAVTTGGVPAAAVSGGGRAAIDALGVWEGLFSGVAQVFLQRGVVVGALFLVGIFVSSRIDAAMAVAGSALGLAVGWVLGVAQQPLAQGLMGYNAVLTMMALGGLFYILDRYSVLLAAIAAAASVVTMLALSASVAPFGGSVYTAPFVLTTWAFIAAKPFLHRVRAVPPADATTPEGNLNLYRVSGHWWER